MVRPAAPTGSGSWGFYFYWYMPSWRMIRASFFIDGFNLYHAIKRLDGPHLKWLDLMALMRRQIQPRSEAIAGVHYFSAYAHWWPHRKARHEQYVAALECTGVEVVMGQFKVKDRRCPACKHSWRGHEEKETDVNIALWLLDGAYRDTYDRAYLVSRDSDLVPAVKMVRSKFPHKEVYIVAPPHLGHSNDLVSVASGKRKTTKAQIEQCLLPEKLYRKDGTLAATRPAAYAP